MQDKLNNPEDEKYEEEWKVITSTKGEYQLSKIQAMILMQAIARKEKAVVFETFTIFIPFIAEFYRVKRFLKNNWQLTARAKEAPYEPVPKERWEKFMKSVYRKIGTSRK